MSWSWKIQKAAVEQEILFLSEDVYENYLAKLIAKEESFEIVNEKANEDGTYTVVMRKEYNNTPFFQKENEILNEQFKNLTQKMLMEETEKFMAEVEADPRIWNAPVPQNMHDTMMARIRENEKKITL